MAEEKKVKYTFSARIRIRKIQKEFIKAEKDRLGNKTLAGTLDMIINKYKKL